LDDDIPLHGVETDREFGSGVDRFGRFRPLVVELDLATGNRGGREAAGFKKTRSPQPLVQTLFGGVGF